MGEWYLVLIVVCVVAQAAAQGMNDIVNEAVNSVFRGVAGRGGSPVARFGQTLADFGGTAGTGPSPALGQIPTSKYRKI